MTRGFGCAPTPGILNRVERIKHASKLGDTFDEPDAHEVSFLVLFEGWVQDVVRLHSSLDRHLDADWELVVVDNPVDAEGSERIGALDRTKHLPLRDAVGYGAGRNLALRQATGSLVCVVDTSVELDGDVARPLSEALAEAAVGIVGRWGVCTTDGYHFEECDGPDVDGVEGYFMAMRRSGVARTGMFDPKFRFYRNADIDLSFQVRAAGLRTIIDQKLPLVRHEHRLWTSTPEAERDELSRKNFFRFRDHWGDREDLFTPR